MVSNKEPINSLVLTVSDPENQILFCLGGDHEATDKK